MSRRVCQCYCCQRRENTLGRCDDRRRIVELQQQWADEHEKSKAAIGSWPAYHRQIRCSPYVLPRPRATSDFADSPRIRGSAIQSEITFGPRKGEDRWKSVEFIRVPRSASERVSFRRRGAVSEPSLTFCALWLRDNEIKLFSTECKVPAVAERTVEWILLDTLRGHRVTEPDLTRVQFCGCWEATVYGVTIIFPSRFSRLYGRYS